MIRVLIIYSISATWCRGGEVNTEVQRCRRQDLPIFHYANCEGGSIGAGAECTCSYHDCRLAYMRQYLPAVSDVQRLQQLKQCRLALSRRLQAYVLNSSKKGRTPGYPIDIDCVALENSIQYSVNERLPHVCSRSIGKFLRFTSLHVYYQYALTLRSNPTATEPNEFTLHDVYYPPTWRPVKRVPACEFNSSKDNGWNCVYRNIFELPVPSSSDEAIVPNGTVIAAFKQLVRSRQSDDNVAQVLLYGLILSILSRPSGAVQAFMDSHLLRLPRDGAADATGRISEISVSMHVRRGDSCDYNVLKEAQFYKTQYLNGPWYARPCFSVDMYMDRLRALHDKYGVSKVYLATDSEEMIARTKLETGFEWVYLNFPRQIYAYQEGWWVDYYGDDSLESVTLSAAADLNLLKQGDVFLGAFTSHFSKLVYYMMVGHQLTLPPFLSMDYPLGCETVDACATADIEFRETTIERMMARTQECLRESEGGFMHESHDHCGFYKTGWRGSVGRQGQKK